MAPPPPSIDFDAPMAPPGAPNMSASTGAAPAASGMGAVFGQISAINVTAGLKKVTKDMKTKNIDAPALQPKAKSASEQKAPAATAKVAEVKKEPKLYLSKGTWFCEHQDGGEITISPVQLKESVYIIKCKNVSINIPDKCKSIQVDSCNKISVVFNQVVSTFEIVNSQRVKVEVTTSVPAVAMDKSSGISLQLSATGAATPPDIVTSNVSEINLVVPGRQVDDDPIEIALPEQYITHYKDFRVHTEPVAHSGN